MIYFQILIYFNRTFFQKTFGEMHNLSKISDKRKESNIKKNVRENR